MRKTNIVIPIGDPAGIGLEVTLKALRSHDIPKDINPILVGCRKNLNEAFIDFISKKSIKIANPNDFEIIDIPIRKKIESGKPCQASGEASFQWLKYATEMVLNKQAKCIVTAPIAKSAWHLAGHKYPGQTELLAELSNTKNVSMLFTAVSPKTGWRFNTLLATTHIPLNKVIENLSSELIIYKLNTLRDFCRKFKNNPIISIAGLNPHAGENGQLGIEEKEWLIPLINEWRLNNKEIKVQGPISPDTCWLSSLKAWGSRKSEDCPDAILALYHDQGLIATKLIAFDEAVNTTLGLPFVRTSPDHGTAFDIAGKGIASPKSMIAAINTAWELSKHF